MTDTPITQPLIRSNCSLVGVLSRDGQSLVDDEGCPILIDLSGGDNEIRWYPHTQILFSRNRAWIEQGQEEFSLRVWKRKHGWLDISGDTGHYKEAPFTDPWATWLDANLDASFLIAGVEFKIMGTLTVRNGVEYWLTGRRVVK